ncbi:MAG: tetratricopeptide repeat protein [Gammaproteobacteria bacterium]|jgi:tetratricopeptide (TPR) repeat protein
MKRNKNFWAGLLVFQVLFGLAVFGVTRAYYLDEIRRAETRQSAASRPVPMAGGISANDIALSSALTMPADDPADVARRADTLFREQQYGRAAELYEQLLDLNPDNVETRNNLGLTLHYLGRHEEALRHLRAGAEAHPEHQRIWLTLGFVNSQLGNIEEARAALTRAAETGDNQGIRESAREMLGALP